MQKKDTLSTGKLTNKNLKAGFKCGECLHFKAHALRSKQQVCSKEGIRSFALAPPCFTPDVTKIASTSDQLAALTSIFQSYSASQRRILLGVLSTKKTKMSFGTKVYFKAVGRDYLSNYLSGFVVGTTSSGDLMVSGDPDRNKRGAAYIATFESTDGLYTAETWPEKRAALNKKGRAVDPEAPLVKFKKVAVPIDYEPPTMDAAPDHWHTKQKAPSKKSKSSTGPKEIRIT